MEDGFITDRLGKKINFTNTIIIFTSNVGVKEINEFSNTVGFPLSSNADQEEINKDKIIEKNLQKKFPVEFINRIDEFIFFKTLSLESIQKIVELELNKIIENMKGNEYYFTFTPRLIETIAKLGFDKKFGARPIKKVIQNKVENSISEMLLTNKILKNKIYEFDIDSSSNVVIVNKKSLAAKK